MKVLFACEEQLVPPFVKSGGSSPVYAACLEALARDHEVYALGFDDPGVPDDYLRSVCADHLILPGTLKSPVLKLARTLSRLPGGTLEAPPWLEERGRDAIKAKIRGFIAKHEPDVLMVQLYHCIRLIGQDVVRDFPGIKIIDVHDDFVRREFMERQIVKGLLGKYPTLSAYERYPKTRTKHMLTRLSVAGARREERRALELFDAMLCANHEDFIKYRREMPGIDVSFSPWPVLSNVTPITPAPQYDAGFIAADHPFQLEGITTFIDTVLPQIRRARPDFTFAIAGGVCAPLAMIYPNHAALGITLLGRIPTVDAFYRSVSTIVVPLTSGTGVSVKTLEAIAYGMRIVTTTVGVRGIPVEDRGPNVTVCDLQSFPQFFYTQSAVKPVPASPWKIDRYLTNFENVVRRVKEKRANYTRRSPTVMAPLGR